jgi:hypothetical protein
MFEKHLLVPSDSPILLWVLSQEVTDAKIAIYWEKRCLLYNSHVIGLFRNLDPEFFHQCSQANLMVAF